MQNKNRIKQVIFTPAMENELHRVCGEFTMKLQNGKILEKDLLPIIMQCGLEQILKPPMIDFALADLKQIIEKKDMQNLLK